MGFCAFLCVYAIVCGTVCVCMLLVHMGMLLLQVSTMPSPVRIRKTELVLYMSHRGRGVVHADLLFRRTVCCVFTFADPPSPRIVFLGTFFFRNRNRVVRAAAISLLGVMLRQGLVSERAKIRVYLSALEVILVLLYMLFCTFGLGCRWRRRCFLVVTMIDIYGDDVAVVDNVDTQMVLLMMARAVVLTVIVTMFQQHHHRACGAMENGFTLHSGLP